MTRNWIALASNHVPFLHSGIGRPRSRNAGLSLESLEARIALSSFPPLSPRPNLNIIVLSTQQSRFVNNYDTVRFENRVDPLHKPVLRGLRGGRVILAKHLAGTPAIRSRPLPPGFTTKVSALAPDSIGKHMADPTLTHPVVIDATGTQALGAPTA
jgi:hypothetical protein